MSARDLKIFCLAYLFNIIFCQNEKFIFYDVSNTEGFNLRRDVYIRIANFVRKLNESDNWTVVLPPWHNVYHWKTTNLIYWRDLFDLKSMNKVVKVIEYDDYISIKEHNYVDISFILKNHPDTILGDFSPKVDIISCKTEEELKTIFKFSRVHRNICLNVRVDISEFADFFNDFVQKHYVLKSFYIHDAEKLIHGKYSEWSEEYWTIRRSMVFSSKLQNIGNEFRKQYLNSYDISDGTIYSDDWRVDRSSLSPPKGGPFVSAHLRRADFIWNREENFPTVEEIILDLKKICQIYNLSTVFMATDTSFNEKQMLKSMALAYNITILFYSNVKLHPGEIAIIDQWVASHGRAFIGSFQSTFTFRIFEERQIMGFRPSTTYNTFCPERLKNPDPEEDCCSKPSIWPVKFESKYTLFKMNVKNEL